MTILYKKKKKNLIILFFTPHNKILAQNTIDPPKKKILEPPLKPNNGKLPFSSSYFSTQSNGPVRLKNLIIRCTQFLPQCKYILNVLFTIRLDLLVLIENF